MTNRDLLALARNTLTIDEFAVWTASTFSGLGRRAGSLALGISEEAFRWRLAKGARKMDAAINERKENAA